MSRIESDIPEELRKQLVLLEELEKKGALQLLIVLLKRDFFISELIDRRTGVISQPTLEKRRNQLIHLGLIEEVEKINPITQKPRLYLHLTEQGRVIAEKAKALSEVL